MDWIEVRPDILSGLILVQSVCKGSNPVPLTHSASTPSLGSMRLRIQIERLRSLRGLESAGKAI